jgi:hypothetical protein
MNTRGETLFLGNVKLWVSLTQDCNGHLLKPIKIIVANPAPERIPSFTTGNKTPLFVILNQGRVRA